MDTNTSRPGVILAAILLLATPGASAETAKFQQGVDGYTETKDVELRGGKAAPDAAPTEVPKKKAETQNRKGGAPKKKAETAKKAEAPKGSDSSISVDLDNDGLQSVALIRFDDIIGKGRGQVPPGSTVTAAVLTLHGNNAGGGKFHVHRLLADWDVSSITWDTAKFGGNTEGGIQADGQEATAPFGSFASNRTGTFEIDVLPAVKLWVAGTAKNEGLAFTSDSTNGWDFDTSEADEVDRRPMLTITFTPPAAR
jgi:hypothetical protein